MTDFELISLFNQFFDDTFSRLVDFMTGTFAMLISAFFVGARLSKNMARLVVLLYTLFAVATSVPTLAATFRFVKAANLLEQRAADPESLVREIFLTFPNPYLVMPVMVLILAGCYAGTLAFFHQTRKGSAPQAAELM